MPMLNSLCASTQYLLYFSTWTNSRIASLCLSLPFPRDGTSLSKRE